MILEINVKVDVGDLAERIDEDTTLGEVVKQEVIRKVVEKIISGIKLSDLKEQTEQAYRERVKKYVDGMAQSTEWLVDNINSNAYVKNLARTMMPDVVRQVAEALRKDPEFVRSVAAEALKTK